MRVIKIKSPEECIRSMRDKTTLQEFRAFIIMFLFGLCLYIPMITQRLNCSDGNICGIFYRTHNDYDIEDIAGRYLLKYLAHMKSMFVFSWMAVIVGLVSIAIGCVLIARILRIKSFLGILLCGILFMVSPCFTETFTFYYAADAYLLCFPLVVIAVYLLHENPNLIRMIFASICMWVSMAFYQAYIFVAISLFLFVLLRDLLENQRDWKEIGKKLLYQMTSGVIAFITYALVNKMLKVVGLIYYQESRFDLKEVLNPIVLLSRIDEAYRNFFEYYFTMSIINNVWKGRNIVNGVIFLLGVAILIACIYRKKLQKSRAVACFLVTLLLPIAIMGIGILYKVSIIVLPTASLIYVGVLALWENERNKQSNNLRSICGWVFYGAVIWLVFIMSVYICIFQICKKYYADKTDAMAQRIITRIEMEYPDAGSGTPVFICGNVDDGNYPQDYNIQQASYILKETDACSGMFIDNMQGYFAGWNKYMAANFGVEYTMVWDKAWEIYDSDFYKDMPLFPAEGSILKNEEGIIVVKLKE